MTRSSPKTRSVVSASAWVRSLYWVFANRHVLKVSPTGVQRAVQYFATAQAPKAECSAAAAFLSEFADLLQTVDETDSRLAVIGPHGDGGYWTFNPTHFSHVLSGGAGDNIDFEVTMNGLGANVVIFDPYVTALPQVAPRIQWIRKPLGEVDGSRKGVSLHEAFLAAGFHPDLRTLMKLDIEGSEWQILDAEFTNLGQLIVEFHDMHRLRDDTFRARATRIFQKLRENFEVVAIHPNNYRPRVIFDSWIVADTFEVTLVNRLLAPRRDTPFARNLPDNSNEMQPIDDVLARVIPIET